jgi:hypothetical protein
MTLIKMRTKALGGAVVMLCALVFSGCKIFHQPGIETNKVFSKVFLVDYNTAWQASLDALRSFDKTKQNRAGGIIQTAWVDNTSERAFIDAFGGQTTFLKSRFRMTIAVSPGTYKGKPSVKVSVEKEQQVQRDPLEGWKSLYTDGLDENTMLYRISRIIYMKVKLQKIEEAKLQEAIQQGF